MRLYLTGFMASGKSTVGPKVAARLGCTFLDLDRLISVQDGRSIPTIFSEDGEATFRQLETEALRKTVETENLVVALGGGALVDDANRAFALEHGRVVYLKVSPETVLARVGDEADQRPLLQDETGTPLPREQMRTRIETMIDERTASYEEAHVTVDANRDVAAVVDAVTDAAREWAQSPDSEGEISRERG